MLFFVFHRLPKTPPGMQHETGVETILVMACAAITLSDPRQ